MANGAAFPAFLKLEYSEDGTAKASFLREVAQMTGDAKRQFESSFNEIGRMLDKSLSSFKSGKFNFQVDMPGLRQAAADADHAVQRLTAMRDAATSLARETGDTSSATSKYVQALQAQVREAQQSKAIADAQVTTYQRLQSEIDQTVAGNKRLAQSFRDTFTEQARAANYASSYQSAINSVFAPGLGRQARSAQDSAAAFEYGDYGGRGRRQDLNFGGQFAQLGYATAQIDAAVGAGTKLDQVLGRVATKSGALAAALKVSADAADQQAIKTQRLATAINQLEGELDPLIAIQQRFTAQMKLADDALAAGAISASRHSQIQGTLTRDLNQTMTALAGSSRAVRQAALQAGQQLQDVWISLYSGQKASIVFAQQLPQLAFALTGLEGSANKTADRVGRLATTLSGPWGLAAGLAMGAAFELAGAFLDVGNESDKAGKKTFDFSKNLADLKINAKDAATAMAQLAQETANAVEKQGTFYGQRAATANESVEKYTKEVAKQKAEITRLEQRIAEQSAIAAANPIAGAGAAVAAAKAAYDLSQAKEALRTAQEALDSANTAVVASTVTRAQQEVIAARDAAAGATRQYTEDLGKLNAQLTKSLELDRELAKAEPHYAAARRNRLEGGYITTAQYKQRLDELEARNKAAQDAAAAAERTSKLNTTAFISPVAGATITGRFGENRGNRQHAGVDLAVPVGTPVKAPAGGVIIESGRLGNYGNVVFIDHGGGTITRLAHLSQLNVKRGDVVEQGAVVGLSGGARGAPGAGNSRGPHVHQEVLVNGKPVNPLAGRFATDDASAAQRAQKITEQIQREAEELQRFGDRSAESIARVNERFNEQPRLIDQAAQATRQLDDIIKDLAERKPPGFQQMIADAERAKTVVTDALVRPIKDMERDSNRRLHIQELIVTGREREADAVQAVWAAQRTLGEDLKGQEATVRRIAQAEYDRTEALRIQQDRIRTYLDASRSIRSEIEAIFAGEGNLGNFQQIFKRLNAQVLTQNIFGSMFDDFDKWIKQNSGLGRATDAFTAATEQGGNAALAFADALIEATGRINAGAGVAARLVGANDNPAAAALRGAGSVGSAIASIAGALPGLYGGGGGQLGPDGEIVVNGRGNQGATTKVAIAGGSVMALSPTVFFEEFRKRFSASLDASLSSSLGPGLSRAVSGVLGGAMAGYAVGGAPGGVLGGLKSAIETLPKGVQKSLSGVTDKLGTAIEGAGTGSTVKGIADMLGVKMSGTGAQIGGAIGSMIPIPGGQIIGSILGGLIGYKPQWATSVASNNGVSNAGNNSDWRSATGGAAGSINNSIASIAERLGGTIGTYSVSIGLNDGNWHVSTIGREGRLRGNQGWSDVTDFKKDQAAAQAFAIMDAIKDGAIAGLRSGSTAILKAANDVDRAVQDVLDFESIFSRLKEFKDPLGARLDTLDKEFKRFRELATTAGEGMAEAEELYGLERKKIIEEYNKQIIGSLKSLYEELTIGDNGLSLRARQANAQAAYDPLRARVEAGDTTAYDDYATAAKTLLDITRQIEGSQSGYFSLFDEITSLSKGAIDRQSALIDAASNRDSPFSTSAVPANDNSAVVAAIEAMGYSIVGALNAQLTATNQNLGAIIEQLVQAGTIVPNYSAYQFAGNW